MGFGGGFGGELDDPDPIREIFGSFGGGFGGTDFGADCGFTGGHWCPSLLDTFDGFAATVGGG